MELNFIGLIRSSKYRMETIPRLVGINLQICYNIPLLVTKMLLVNTQHATP